MKRREVDFDKIPEALRALPQWVLWRTMMRHGKPAKMPLQPTGIAAKSNDPSTWRDFREISAYYNPAHGGGIGFVFSPEDPFCGVDLDGCRDPETGVVAEWARKIITAVDTYAEVSPSGTGVKLFVRAFCERGGRCKVDAEKVSTKTPGLEVYDSGRYFAVTGWRLQGRDEPQERDQAIAELLEQYFYIPRYIEG